MSHITHRARAGLLVAIAATAVSLTAAQQTPPGPFQLEETTIAQIHAALKSRQLTCRALVEQYLKRIESFDKAGPAINAIVQVNPNSLAEADALDRRASQGTLVGPLHCIPTIVKDNFETIGLQSADGSLSLKGFVSDRDAFQVKRIKAAGAIVLAKSNMAEFAFSPVRDRQLDPAWIHEESLRARPGDRRFERRHRRRRCRELRRDWPRQ